MQVYLTLTRRELGVFFVSVTGYIILSAAVLLIGLSFVATLLLVSGEPTTIPVTQMFFSAPFFWFILLLASPVITMRLFALEKYSGTFETLMTTPVSDLQVVLAKFTAAMFFFAILWLPTIVFIIVLRQYVTNMEPLDPGLLASTFLGILLLGALFVSMGCFASAITRNQIIAAMISFTVGFVLFLLSFLPDLINVRSTWLGKVLSQLSLIDHMNEFARGLVDTRHLVFYLSFTFLFLFLTLRAVESRRWK